MKRKQILNYIFEDLSDGTVKVTLPNGIVNILNKQNAEHAYTKLYAAKYADSICEQALREVGYTKENIYLTPYSVQEKFRKTLEYLLYTHKVKIDLTYDNVITKKWKVKIGGNISEIVSSYIEYLWKTP